jgi:hypothetical protein
MERATKRTFSRYFERGIYNVENAMKLSGVLLSLVVVANCAAGRPPLKKPWRVEVQSSGGLAGRGMGTYAINSDGKLDATLPNGRPCSATIESGRLRELEKVLGETQPAAWKDSYVPENSCCDRFEYSLTFDEAGKETRTRWIDDPSPMPPDLEALTQAIIHGPRSIRVQAAELCR